jgi:hypothetical protein
VIGTVIICMATVLGLKLLKYLAECLWEVM